MNEPRRDETDVSLHAPSRGYAHSTSNGEALARTAPSTSTLRVEATPITGQSLETDLPMLKLATFGFPEELMHGERQKFGLARNVRLLKAVSRNRLYSYLHGEIPLEEAAKDIYECQLACDQTTRLRREFLETVDQFRIHSVVDRDYLGSHARSYADTYDEARDDVLDELETERKLLKNDIRRKLLYDEVYRPLEELAETYSPSVAEAVAHAALDVQAVVHPLEKFVEADASTITTSELSTEFFLERFDQARSELERLTLHRSPSNLDRDALRRRLLQGLPPESEGAYHPAPLRNIPLLDEPTKLVGDPENVQDGKQSMDEAGTIVDRILNGAFRVVGNLGGVIYPVDDGDRKVLVNPWVADSPVEDVVYQELWQQEFFGDHVVTTLWKSLKREIPPQAVAVTCPLCEVSPGVRCGENFQCRTEAMRETINDRLEPLMHELYNIQINCQISSRIDDY